jgi:hypothetical protein
MDKKTISAVMSLMGKQGGQSTSEAKQEAVRKNGKQGGRPKGKHACIKYPSHRFNPNTNKCYGCGFKRKTV